MYSSFGTRYLCALFGKTRQAYYDQIKASGNDQGLTESLVLRLVGEIRVDLPRCGTPKLHFMLQQRFVEHGIKMGRDALNSLLGEHGMLIRYRRRKPYTTDSNHAYKKYPNLIRDMALTAPGQLWVSDITYLRISSGFGYLSIITDAYSHKIVGYRLHPTLHSQGAIDALLMAAKDVQRKGSLIHHSDRGTQYCCTAYVTMIEHLGVQLSMTEKGDPYENAIAERVNGILKHELGLNESFSTFEQATAAVDSAIRRYNSLRPHDSCDRLTPLIAHEQTGILKKHWKPKVYKQQAATAQST